MHHNFYTEDSFCLIVQNQTLRAKSLTDEVYQLLVRTRSRGGGKQLLKLKLEHSEAEGRKESADSEIDMHTADHGSTHKS